eukprot:Sdes_comp19667_c0_seq1m11523
MEEGSDREESTSFFHKKEIEPLIPTTNPPNDSRPESLQSVSIMDVSSSNMSCSRKNSRFVVDDVSENSLDADFSAKKVSFHSTGENSTPSQPEINSRKRWFSKKKKCNPKKPTFAAQMLSPEEETSLHPPLKDPYKSESTYSPKPYPDNYREEDTMYGITRVQLGNEIRQKISKYRQVMEINQTHRYIIRPGSKIKYYWDWFMISLVFYIVISAPVLIAFSDFLLPIVLQILVDCCFIIDMFINFRTGYIDSTGRPVVDPTLIAQRYFKSWFTFDLIAAIPYSLIQIFTDSLGARCLILAKAPRILRIRQLVSGLGYWTSAAPFRILYLFLFWLLIAHWCASGWWLVGHHIEGENSSSWVSTYKSKRDGVIHDPYLTSLYFCVTTLSTVGYGDVTPETMLERVYVVCMMFLGTLVYAFIFGNVSSIVSNLDSISKENQLRLQKVNQLIRAFDIPYAMQYRIWSYVDHNSLAANNYNIHATLGNLPPHLIQEVALYIHEPLLMRIFPFAGKDFHKAIASKLRWCFAVSKDFLAREGEVGDCIFIIWEGAAEVLSIGEQVDLLGPGDFFGENMLSATGATYQYSLRALSFCDFFVLTREDLCAVASQFPSVKTFLTHRSDPDDSFSQTTAEQDMQFFIHPVRDLNPNLSSNRRSMKPDQFGYFVRQFGDEKFVRQVETERRKAAKVLR